MYMSKKHSESCGITHYSLLKMKFKKGALLEI